jgi:hypothetical protein
MKMPKNQDILDRTYPDYPFLPCVMIKPSDFWILRMYSAVVTLSQHLLRADGTPITDALEVYPRVFVILRIGINTVWDSEYYITFFPSPP